MGTFVVGCPFLDNIQPCQHSFLHSCHLHTFHDLRWVVAGGDGVKDERDESAAVVVVGAVVAVAEGGSEMVVGDDHHRRRICPGGHG